MSIIKRTDRARVLRSATFNLDDIAHEARVQAETIIARAKKESERIRQEAEQQGREAALTQMDRMVDENVGKKMETLFPVLNKAIADIHDARHQWLRHWEQSAVHVATAIAKRIVRRELKQDPQITMTLVREALELASGSPSIRLRLNPSDHESLGNQTETLIKQLVPLAPAEVIADAEIEPGGCIVETRFGLIDQQIEAQIDRIEEELI